MLIRRHKAMDLSPHQAAEELVKKGRDYAIISTDIRITEFKNASANELQELLQAFADQHQDLLRYHDDPRGLCFFSDVAEPDSNNYEAIVDELGDAALWIQMPPATAPAAEKPKSLRHQVPVPDFPKLAAIKVRETGKTIVIEGRAEKNAREILGFYGTYAKLLGLKILKSSSDDRGFSAESTEYFMKIELESVGNGRHLVRLAWTIKN